VIKTQNITTDLRHLPAHAAALIERVGWTQGTERDETGRVCLTGALKYCDPQPGDWLIAREVFRTKGRAEGWNDAKGRTRREVLDLLLSTEITDVELALTFGPSWETVVALVRTAATITTQQVLDLGAAWGAAWGAARGAARDAARGAAWGAAWGAARGAARDAARDAAWDAARDAARGAAWDAARDAAWGAARGAARGAAWDAAWGAVTRDLIGQHGYTQAHYDELTRPWREAVGRLHPDDAELRGAAT